MFCGLTAASILVVIAAHWMGLRQVDDPQVLSGFITSGVIAGFGIFGLSAMVWLMFDDNVSKPIEAIAASLRVRAHADVTTPVDVDAAKYLGDLAPAAQAAHDALDAAAQNGKTTTDSDVDRLIAQRDQLVAILSDIPIATILVSADHQIALYDGQAAALMERVGTAKLKTSVFEYLESEAIQSALAGLAETQEARSAITVEGRCGEVYHGHIRSFGMGQGYTLMLEPHALSPARAMTYDFGLLKSGDRADLEDRLLSDLVYVVFDTETTGLDPQQDEVVQLGAVRIVNGKIVDGEVYDSLVHPSIPIPRKSTDVHGIDDQMVAHAPDFAAVCDGFHGFARDAVLVAHNAPFDMAFVHRQAASNSIDFDNPVLDTVLLSAVVFGGAAIHTLDAICDRLNITIPIELRHTAMGDAVATAKALIAMILILQGRGITTFDALLVEANKHQRILKG
jgi:DNA polymerase-3 subunit epsilon